MSYYGQYLTAKIETINRFEGDIVNNLDNILREITGNFTEYRIPTKSARDGHVIRTCTDDIHARQTSALSSKLQLREVREMFINSRLKSLLLDGDLDKNLTVSRWIK